jgi:hypothetical protein
MSKEDEFQPQTLPALHVEVTGLVTASNVAEFKAHAMAVLQGVNTSLSTDQEFADAEAALKWCSGVESKIESAKSHAMGQAEPIDALMRTLDEIKDQARRVRLRLGKQVATRKQEIRDEILRLGEEALSEHLAKINSTLAPAGVSVTPPDADFGGAMKGKRTVASLQSAVDTTLAWAKIDANSTADRIRTNLQTLESIAPDKRELFADLAYVVGKPPDDFAGLVMLRLSEHRAADTKRVEAEARRLLEAEDRVRAEEQAKNTAEIKSGQERREQEEALRLRTEAHEDTDGDERAGVRVAVCRVRGVGVTLTSSAGEVWYLDTAAAQALADDLADILRGG